MNTNTSYIIRRATMADAEAIARVNIDVWRSTYTGLIGQEMLDAMSLDKYITKWQRTLGPQNETICFCFVAEIESEIVGYVLAGKTRQQELGYLGELSAIYLLDTFQGTGIGKDLFYHAMKEFINRDIHGFSLFVLKENKIGRRFYDRYEPDEIRATQIEIDGGVYCDMLYGWHSVEKILEKFGAE